MKSISDHMAKFGLILTVVAAAALLLGVLLALTENISWFTKLAKDMTIRDIVILGLAWRLVNTKGES